MQYHYFAMNTDITISGTLGRPNGPIIILLYPMSEVGVLAQNIKDAIFQQSFIYT